MSSDVPAPTGRSAPSPRPPLEIRPAHLGDIPALNRLYRGQSPETRLLYHPFPFDRIRLTAIFGFMVATRHSLRFLLRHRPDRALVLLVVHVPGRRDAVAYGSVGFVRTPDQGLRAIFGYLVDPESRGLGIGTKLHVAMIESALALGVRRGGGMVVATNFSNLRVLEKLGFTITESTVVDAAVPGAKNYVTDGDLEAIALRWRELPPAPV